MRFRDPPRGGLERPNKHPLSIILCSRNDRYMGNSRWRLETTLNYLAAKVHGLGRQGQVTILVADWGSEIPLREVVQLGPAAAGMVSFVQIPPDIARELQKDSPFPEVLALNAATRRAEGEYVGRIDQDTLVGEKFLTTFFALYEGRQQLHVPLRSALLFANRRGIPYRFAVRCPSLDSVDRLIRLFADSLPVHRHREPFWASYVGIWLAHRDVWFECRGYNEQFLYMNVMEVEMVMRLLQRYEVVNIGDFVECAFYHLDHYPTTDMWAGHHRKVNPELDLDRPPKEVLVNNPHWGLAQYPIDVLPYSLTAPSVDTGNCGQAGTTGARVALELLSIGAQLVWDKRSRPLDVARLLATVARSMWRRCIDMLKPVPLALATWIPRSARTRRGTHVRFPDGRPRHDG